MLLQQLNIVNYRNILQADLEFSPKLNGFIGNNGMGKTNVLDAIYHLSFCKGAICPSSDAFNICLNTDFFLLQGRYECEDGKSMNVSCGLKRGGRKRIKCDGKDYKRFSEHLGKIPLVMLSPSDHLLVSGGSDERRRFLDTVISQYDTAYLTCAIRYDRTLKQRNAALKSETMPENDIMDVWEEMMAHDAHEIFIARKSFIEEFQPIFRQVYERLCPNESIQVEMIYTSHGVRGDLKDLLETYREREHIVGYTLHGTHKDDLELQLNGFPVKREGSQGQTKTFFIAMKLAQFIYLRKKVQQRMPILLLDDIFDKLDAHRVERIIALVGSNDFGQIFITDTNRDHLDGILSASQHDYRLFEVKDGEVFSAQ